MTRTLELGSGTGLNLAHYPDDLDKLILTEPDTTMRKRLERRLRRSGRSARVLDARAEWARLAYWQDRLAEPWRRFVVGCRCDRATIALMEACGLELEVRDASWSGLPAIVRPLVVGRAIDEGLR